MSCLLHWYLTASWCDIPSSLRCWGGFSKRFWDSLGLTTEWNLQKNSAKKWFNILNLIFWFCWRFNEELDWTDWKSPHPFKVVFSLAEAVRISSWCKHSTEEIHKDICSPESLHHVVEMKDCLHVVILARYLGLFCCVFHCISGFYRIKWRYEKHNQKCKELVRGPFCMKNAALLIY